MMPERFEHALGFNLDDWSDFEIRLVIEGRWVTDKAHPKGFWLCAPISFKRHWKSVRIGRHSRIVLDTEAKKWQLEAAAQLRDQWSKVFCIPIPKTVPLNAAIISYLPNKRLADASNLYQGPEDAMQACNRHCKPKCQKHAGVIEDDVAIEGHDGSGRRIDRARPRVEITLTPAPHRSVLASEQLQLETQPPDVDF